MSEAVFSVAFAGPLATVQDAGRPGNMRFGVSTSGPMDRLSIDAAHAALGNAPDRAGIEVSMGGLVLQCTSGAVTLAITGGDFVVEHAGKKSGSWTILTIHKGERLAIRAGKSGSWAYLTFAGTLRSNSWLGSQATHSTSGFGGGALATGQTLTIEDAALREDRAGDVPRPGFSSQGAIRVVTGPQDHCFAQDAVARFLSEPFRVTDACDRMGMRLAGPSLTLDGALSIPSEPIIRGSVQVSGDGVATVLLADHQTTGGYPKIATVLSCDTDMLAQLRSKDSIRFSAVSRQQAVMASREFHAHKAKYLGLLATSRGTLAERLIRENLNSGWCDADT
jgi:biotin-dependent carboxylase-like uncharacterized protein